MAKYDVFDLTAKKVGEVELADSVFGIEPNDQAIFDAVLLQQASWRQGTHDTKSRGEVSGGGKKPYRQKGTGRARQGSTRATQWRHGGIPFGPTPRSYTFKLNRKVRRLALKSGLSLKAKEENITVLNGLTFENAKTKEFVKLLDTFNLDQKVLFVIDAEEDFENAYLASRNLPKVEMVTVEGLNIFDLMNAKKLVVTEAAGKKLGEVLA
ncbi:MAG: 50S ribosomal protein L4 [Erysipelotrichaceae bacterium]|nr:50S ribosomal protein L4 [Erysipelotrichaceae bacterium]MBQ1810790.1 50S ribosomal protein L4 [Erysipelotrichaceae bacterium]MBQ5756247.1 50S ribosomal protein L4 [Erysipelotrichaceae bacterium]MBR3151896.1 50S ribosomal protein L4 [Erysipelotrichaceae bacterium]MBR3167400.1 50S ribosomal protein L4 [Erysipelotrichaceae bacterium]